MNVNSGTLSGCDEYMKTILLHQHGLRANQLFDPDVRDYCNDPYIALRQKLRDLGYDLRTLDDHAVTEAEWVLFFDAPSVFLANSGSALGWLRHARRASARDVYAECIDAGLRHRIVLFLWEPTVVVAGNFNTTLHERFPIIATWHDGYINKARYHKICYPQPKRLGSVEVRSYSQKKLLVNISGNKSSTHSRELYSQRRATIRHFEQAQPTMFDLYGVGWERRSWGDRFRRRRAYTSYRGRVENKWQVYPFYRFGVCYENMRDEPGYVTEKIFDCMRANCVPIYWGASNVAAYIAADAFIDRTMFGSNSELERFLVDMPEAEYDRLLEAGRDYLSSSMYQQFSEDAFVERIIGMLKLTPA